MQIPNPQSNLVDPSETLLSFARCFGLSRRSIVYVSAPITTGRRYLEWRISRPAERENKALESAHRRDVIRLNISAAESVVQHVRSTFSHIVVDPTQLDDIQSWEQPDYHNFWATFIQRFAATVVFVDGWQYSTGCSIELITAYRHGIKTLDQRLDPLEPNQAASLLSNAIEEFDRARLNQSRLKESWAIVSQIENLNRADAPCN